MSTESDDLMAEARTAAEEAYAPYSNFRVGAVVVAADGTRYPGANVENAAYGSAMCAEAVAIGRAVSSGVRKIDTVAAACIDADEDCYPCGDCRQLMSEFGVEQIIVGGPTGEVREHSLEELLPHGFKLESHQ
ncbi:MAG: cytidine deaminase [Acidimicrobiia bacterium]